MTGIVIFRDEQGNEATYRFATDGDESGDQWVSICERAVKRLGLKPDPEADRRWLQVQARTTGEKR